MTVRLSRRPCPHQPAKNHRLAFPLGSRLDVSCFLSTRLCCSICAAVSPWKARNSREMASGRTGGCTLGCESSGSNCTERASLRSSLLNNAVDGPPLQLGAAIKLIFIDRSCSPPKLRSLNVETSYHRINPPMKFSGPNQRGLGRIT